MADRELERALAALPERLGLHDVPDPGERRAGRAGARRPGGRQRARGAGTRRRRSGRAGGRGRARAAAGGRRHRPGPAITRSPAAVRSTYRPRPSPGGRRRTPPCRPRWACRQRPSAVWTSRCFPRASTPETTAPAQRPAVDLGADERPQAARGAFQRVSLGHAATVAAASGPRDRSGSTIVRYDGRDHAVMVTDEGWAFFAAWGHPYAEDELAADW